LRWVIVETIGLFIEMLLWTFAFTLVWGLNTRLHRRVKLLIIFAARLMYVYHVERVSDHLTINRRLVPIVAIHLIRLSPSAYHHTIKDIIETSILAQMIIHWALISECLTCLKPFLQTWHEGVPTDSNTPQYWGALSNLKSNHSTHQRSGAEKSNQRVGALARTQQTAEGEREGALKLRSDDSGFSTKIASQRRGSSAAWTAETDDDIELLPASSIRVRMTTTMTSS
jgi:hypothetical protein